MTATKKEKLNKENHLDKMIIQRVKRQAKEERTKIINRISELDEIIKDCDKSIDNSNKHIDKIIKGE